MLAANLVPRTKWVGGKNLGKLIFFFWGGGGVLFIQLNQNKVHEPLSLSLDPLFTLHLLSMPFLPYPTVLRN